MNKWGIVVIIIILTGLALLAGITAGYRKDTIDVLRYDNKVLVAQNKKLTADVREAKVQGFRDGLNKCTNEDVKFFNDMADEFPGSELDKVMTAWAKTWAYDEDTTNLMVEEYMAEGTE